MLAINSKCMSWQKNGVGSAGWSSWNVMVPLTHRLWLATESAGMNNASKLANTTQQQLNMFSLHSVIWCSHPISFYLETPLTNYVTLEWGAASNRKSATRFTIIYLSKWWFCNSIISMPDILAHKNGGKTILELILKISVDLGSHSS